MWAVVSTAYERVDLFENFQLIKLIDRSTEDVEGVAEAIGLLMKLGKSPKEVKTLTLVY